MKKCFFIIVIAFFTVFIAPQETFAQSGFIITSYDINMLVNEDNSFDITENIGVYFNEPRRGIFRSLPLRNEIVRLDGTMSSNRAVISDILASEQFTEYNERGYRVIRIGNPDITIRGAKDYQIKYNYNIGRDTRRGYDELYFNLIGSGWDTTVDNISFTITMPKSFNQSKLGFSAGAGSSAGGQNVSYEVNGNVITGRYNGTLGPNESLTVMLELPDGYFVNASYNFDFLMLVALFLPVIFVICYFIVWKKYGKDDEVIETVEFYPPAGFNSAEIGLWYNGSARDKDIISLLIYLANKGYIKIAETENESLFSLKKEFRIIKIRDYDGGNENEEMFIKGLFYKNLYEATAAHLKENFYTTLGKIKKNLNNKKNREKIFEKISLGKGFTGVAMAVITLFLITVRPYLETGNQEVLFFVLFFTGMGFWLLIDALTGLKREEPKRTAKSIILGSIISGTALYLEVLPVLLIDFIYSITYIVGLACIAGIMMLYKNMPKRTPHGNEILGRIRGFKNFLEVAEKEKLEELVNVEPGYFYNILPYTYVLGVSDKWIKKFEAIALQAPDWYAGSTIFNTVVFSSFMNSTMASVTTASSGGFGGGLSGRGSGGGRGGSW